MFTSLAIPLVAILTAIAGVVTPLGLYEDSTTRSSVAGSFQYVRDSGGFWDGTSPRKGLEFSRFCTFILAPGPCPFNDDTLIFTKNSSTSTWSYPDGLHSRVAPVVKEIYSSGTKNRATTVSNFFDIEWRQLTTTSGETYDNGTAYAVGAFRQLDSVLLWDDYRPVEGLVVDAKGGGIGFRNHTVPTGLTRKASWSEDLLFIEPETVCVDTNTTLDYTITSNLSSNSLFVGYRLTDRGGFADLSHDRPWYDKNNSQANPDLWRRAYKSAWFNNYYSMVYFNITPPRNNTVGLAAFDYVTSKVGDSYPIKLPVSKSLADMGLEISSLYGGYLFEGDSLSSRGDNSTVYPNPWNVTQSDWFDAICKPPPTPCR
jgi:hypothetical protein